jgi:hypothetical protein
MLILKAISLGPLHGYGILVRIQQISKDRLEILQGSLYPGPTDQELNRCMKAGAKWKSQFTYFSQGQPVPAEHPR